MVDSEELWDRLSRELRMIVSLNGVDVNKYLLLYFMVVAAYNMDYFRVCFHKHMQSQLAFVSGLGLRKVSFMPLLSCYIVSDSSFRERREF